MHTDPKKVSQAQIARELGVSQTLVSLVLNGHRTGIKPATYERIWQHTTRCGYRAKGMNPLAAATKLPPQIGVIVPPGLDLSGLGNYLSHVQQGLHAGLDDAGGTTVFLGSADALDEARLQRLFPKGHQLHGLAIFGDVPTEVLNRLQNLQLPLARIATRSSGHGHRLSGDESQSLSLLVNHLHELGHRAIGWLGGKSGHDRHHIRHAAFRSALAARDLSPNPRFEITLPKADRAEGAEAIHALLPLMDRPDFPTAFVCYNSLMATGATLALTHAGLSVPHHLSITGADLLHSSGKQEMAITSAGICPRALGSEAARLLLASSPGQTSPARQITFPAVLVKGETAGKARIADVSLRSHSRHPLAIAQ